MATAVRSYRTIDMKPNFRNPLSQTPKFTVPDNSRRRRPTKEVIKKNNRAVAEPPQNLVMGQVKILKRGEVLNDSSRVLKDVNSREGFTGKDPVSDREGSKVVTSGRRFFPARRQKQTENNKKIGSSMGADMEILKNITECFAGSGFFDSPPPSSVPLPGFLRRNLLKT